jgi:hypothetical protein
LLLAVRGLWTWLMVLGVFAGLSLRVASFSHSHEDEHGHGHHHAAEHGSPCHGHGDERPDPDHPGGDCPSESPSGEHHHHACCIPLQLAIEGIATCRLPAPASQRLGLQSLRQVPPDGPCFDLDKPPLI